jgi:hypothetical protein
MELTAAKSDSSKQYSVVKPIFINDEVVGVLDETYVLGTVARSRLKAFRTETRTSFKHPIIGAILGTVMVGVPVQSALGDPLNLWWLTLASPARVAGAVFMLFIGAYLLYGVLRRRDEEWLVLVSEHEERAFPIGGKLAPHVVDQLRELIGGRR